MTETVRFRTADNVGIVGDYRGPANHPVGYVLFLHMMPADRSSWLNLALNLTKENIASLAIDLRGHGESVHQGADILNYKNFTDEDHQASVQDVDAAIGWLKSEQNAPENKIVLVGASIGANLSLTALAKHKDLIGAALLSPGLDYRGVQADKDIVAINRTRKLFMAAAADDIYSLQSMRALAEKFDGAKQVEEFTRGGHGASMLETVPQLNDLLVRWVKEILS